MSTNQAPVNTAPTSLTINPDKGYTFSVNNTPLAINDSDAGENQLRVSLDATNGTVKLGSTLGLPSVTGNESASVTLVGTITQINAALEGTKFTPAKDFAGAASITMTTNDQGFTGDGGAQTDTDTINITVNPTVSIEATTATIDETSSTGTFRITRNSTSGALTVILELDSSSTATQTEDYTFDGSDGLTVTIPDGQSSIDFTLTPKEDVAAEPDETIKLKLASSNNYAVSETKSNATVTISANDTVVTNTNDSGEGSLRQAILNSNALSGTQDITFQLSNNAIINLDSALPTITDSVNIINTKGAMNLSVGGDGTKNLRVFTINSGTTVEINGLTITGGNSSSSGGGILNSGTLNLANSFVKDNKVISTATGGGIHNTGSLTILNSTVSDNSAISSGGGIWTSGTFNLTNSTISGNQTNDNGGGIRVVNGTVNINNSTITDNIADNDGNGTGNGGGISRGNGIINVKNTIIAGNSDKTATTTGLISPDVSGTFVDQGNNLIGNNNGSIGFTVSTLVGTSTNAIDPVLSTLASNGTHSVLQGSPAINAGNNEGALEKDQLGQTRIVGGTIDIGAVESSFTPPIVNFGAATYSFAEASNSVTFSIPVTLSNPGATVIVPTTVTVPVIRGSSTNAQTSDYSLSSTTLTFEAGATGDALTKNVSFTVKPDDLPELDEIVELKFGTLQGANPGTITTTVLTIPANDTIEYSVTTSQENVDESTNGSTRTTVTFNVTRDGGVGVESTVKYDITGTAKSGVDFNRVRVDGLTASLSGTLNFAAGERTKVITLDVLNDKIFEPDETIIVTLSEPNLTDPPASSTISNASATVNIVNDDPKPVVTINNVAITEGNTGVKTAIFTINLSNPSSEDIVVNYNTSNNTAVAEEDYVAVPLTPITFKAGELSQTIAVEIKGDNVFEDDETFKINLTDADDETLAIGIATIINDDKQPAISISDKIIQAEGDDGTITDTLTVTLSNPSSKTVTVGYNTTDGTAVKDEDYVGIDQGIITFEPGKTSKTIDVEIIGDRKFEVDERFNVNLTNPTNGVLATKRTGIVTISNDDTRPIISIDDISLDEEGNENTQDARFTVTLSNPSSEIVTVNYSTTDGTATTADKDYIAVPKTLLTFQPGEITKEITVQVVGDTKFESNETFNVVLADAKNATIDSQKNTGIATISNDDEKPTISISDAEIVDEGNPLTPPNTTGVNAVFTVTLSNASSEEITVNYTTSDGTATVADKDYTETTNSITFKAGEISKQISIPIIGDIKFEPNETFDVNLSLTDTNKATIDDGIGVGTIKNDDAQPTITIKDVTVTEGNTGITPAVFTVELSNPSSEDITVNYSTSDGTAKAEDGDYTAIATTELVFTAGETSKTITVDVQGDTKFESNETFNVNLSDPTTGVTIAKNIGVATITDDDKQPTINISDATIFEDSEGNSDTKDAVFTVTLSNASGQIVTVNYNTSDGTATSADNDYIAISANSLTFAPGETSKEITVAIKGDTKFEDDETFNLNLVSASGGTLTDNKVGVATIKNDDTAPTLAISGSAIQEGNEGTSNAVFTVNLSAASGKTVTVDYSTANDTATASSDYTATNGTLTFKPGEVSQSIVVPILGDFVDELDESFFINLANLSGATFKDDIKQLKATIIDNDTAGITITPTTGTTTETGGTASFTVQLDSQPTADVSFSLNSSNPSEGVASVASITFKPTNWNQAQTILVTGVSDPVDDTDTTYQIITNRATSTDSKYSGIDPADIQLTNTNVYVPPTNIFDGTAEAETLLGGNLGDRINANEGNDLIFGRRGNDELFGNDGNDIIYGDFRDPRVGYFGRSNDVIKGGNGNDIIFGGYGNDWLYGDAGDDLIYGENGNDRLYGGTGNNTLRGGGGNDTFVIGDGGMNTITDFAIGFDVIGLSSGLTYSGLTITQQGNDTLISNNSQQIAILTGVNKDNLTTSSFISL
jgi:hypothetical protein